MCKMTLGQMIVLQIPQELIAEPHLSVPGWENLKGKNGLCRDKKRALEDSSAPQKLPYRGYDEKTCLLPYEEHLQRLNLTPEDPWLLVGTRNLGNNLRIIGYHTNRGLLELNGENATKSGREYCCLCKTPTGLAIHHVRFPNGKPTSDEISPGDITWAVSGQELVWDGKPAPIEKIIPYTYDLRHVWDIEGWVIKELGPRANAGPNIEEMIDRLVELSEKPSEEVAPNLTELAKERGYQRECHYLHSAIGLSKDGGDVIIVQRHGAFEDVASTLVQAGADRAIELDQGGSCSVMMGGTKQDFPSGRTLFASHYFRPRGLALLVFRLLELSDQVFTANRDLLRWGKSC